MVGFCDQVFCQRAMAFCGSGAIVSPKWHFPLVRRHRNGKVLLLDNSFSQALFRSPPTQRRK